ncbi:ketoacyl-ACP synthase III family protein [Streptomyces montanisoli]|uniref:Ketoacyl-ACP synthase III family protein n=1 Tax=Streptomyces montanisoli TaxID=2798581 RepID=A0A940RVT5_9ACTN|nr:ketoacyl-ACP synthase III family protein [Streptomyces montanisoli]MBP0456398.1 ketoacyl-ACP synthase III family protein [Streptomyces montanisoli]
MLISGLGSFLPERVPIGWAVERDLIDRTAAEEYGITSVTVAGETPAPELAVRACRQALERAGRQGESLSLLLYVSVWYQGPHGWCPQYYVQRHTGASRATAAEVRQGCMGMFSALELAASHLMAAPDHEAALITSGDNFTSPLLERWRFSPHFVMGDAGSAVVLSRREGFARLKSINAVTLPEYETMHRGPEPLYPPGATLPGKLDFGNSKDRWLGGPHRDPLGPLKLVAAQDELVERTLDEAGITMDDISRVAYANGSRERVEDRAMVPLGLPMSYSTWEQGRTVGHIGASDQVVALEQLLESGSLQRGDHFLMLGVGPGLNIACAVIEILENPHWSAASLATAS